MTKELRLSIGGGLACLLLLLLVFVPGCTKIPNGGVPIYLLIDSPTVISDFNVTGSPSFRIPDVWAESGNQNLGAYEMPIRIPVLAQGSVPVIITGGIYNNGIISTRVEYPFYRPDTFTIQNAIPGHVYTHHPVYHYYADVNVALNATFENNAYFSNMSIQSGDADSIPSNPNSHCGAIIMAAGDTLATAVQNSSPVINTNGRQAYVELQYRKSNVTDTLAFDVGMEYTDPSGNISDYTLITIFPQQYWKKTYLDFSTLVGSYPGDTFKIYFVVYKNPGVADAVYFDNVKFLYFD